MSSSKGSWSGLQMKIGSYGSMAKLSSSEKKIYTDCCDRVSMKILESIPNPQRLYYKCEKKTCNFIRWWKPTKQ